MMRAPRVSVKKNSAVLASTTNTAETVYINKTVIYFLLPAGASAPSRANIFQAAIRRLTGICVLMKINNWPASGADVGCAQG